jgi:cell division septation protein DedD
VNLPLLGSVHVPPVPAGASAATLLAADNPDELKPVIDLLTQTRKSLTLRSLFLTGFPHDPEFFAAGLALARQWSRQGLKIAVVDLDFRHPTVVRPRPEPNEGLVDALEYGCSFQRISWELVQDALWLVGPGSHPPDERRFPEHPDWTRVMRVFTARVDLVLYLAPFLDRKGFTGALSKRMDGVILSACVRRESRTALRDAFLELWGSDAPMIGCLGIDAPSGPPPAGETELPAETSWAPEQEVKAPPPPPPQPPKPRREPVDTAPQALVTRLSDEVRRGHVPRSAPAPGRGFLVLAVAAILAGAGAFATYQVMRKGVSRPTPAETLPAGNEPVLPADLGTAGAGVPAIGGQQEPSPAPSTTEGEAISSDETGSAVPDEPPAPPVRKADLRYEVHVASYSKDSAAKNLVKHLRDRGLDAWYAKATDQANWYRVFVGHYATHEEAARQARVLLDEGLVEHAIAYPNHAR